MPEPAVHVEELGKRYQLGLTHADSLSDIASVVSQRLRSWVTRKHNDVPVNRKPNAFWALKDVNFDVRKGEVFGVIGRNGAGKSTLLKLISRVTAPTTGRIDIRGRVASLLEVGTGFHPDLTGRENIYMNATLLGMTRCEVNERLDEIVEFAGVEKFLETQVKRYSTGMRVRLGFAVAAHLEPEILVVDEVLTVGDAEFQKKCLGKMQSVASHGRTVLFVSHNMGAVRSLCTRACLLNNGTLATIGLADDVVNEYLQSHGQQLGWIKRYGVDETIDLEGLRVLRPLSFAARTINGSEATAFATDQSIELRFDFIPLQPLAGIRVGILVRNTDNVIMFGSNTTLDHDSAALGRRQIQVACLIPGDLLNRGTYTVDLGVDRPPHYREGYLDQECIRFEVADVEGHGFALEHLPGVVRPRLIWKQAFGDDA